MMFQHVIYLQTEKAKARKNSRLSRTKEDKRRTKCHSPTPNKRTKEACCLSKPTYMLPSSQRLTTPLFKRVMDTGKIFHSPLFSAKILKADGSSRFSVAVSKKIAKNAVDRNRIRRRVYSALHTIGPKVSSGFHVVLMPKAPVASGPFAGITPALKEFFVKTGVLK